MRLWCIRGWLSRIKDLTKSVKRGTIVPIWVLAVCEVMIWLYD